MKSHHLQYLNALIMTNEMLLPIHKSNHTSNENHLLPMYNKVALKKLYSTQ